MKEIKLSIPDFDGSFHLNWQENSKINFKVTESGEGYLKANREGLLSLANHLINLSQDEVFNNYHLHLDEYNSLDKGSIELIIEKDNSL